jgi:hypothetical protein
MNLFTRPWADSGCLNDPSGDKIATLACIWPLFSNIINAAHALSGVVALIYIILAGVQIITANGDAEKISGGKKTLTFAIIGFVFIILSLVIFNLVFTVTGVDQNSVKDDPNGGIKFEQPQ